MKPKFYCPKESILIKAIQPMARLCLDFKGLITSASSNNYLLIVVNELLRFPFVFLCKNTALSSVIKCLEKLFVFTGTPSYIHTDNAASFVLPEFKQYLLKRGIASSKSNIYHLEGSGQA